MARPILISIFYCTRNQMLIICKDLVRVTHQRDLQLTNSRSVFAPKIECILENSR